MLTLLLGEDRQAGLREVIGTICERAQAGEAGQILIVPEQYSFEAERTLCQTGGDGISRFAEVLSFTRLASRVFSIYGGVSVTQPAGMYPLIPGTDPDLPVTFRSGGPADL